MLKKPLNIYKTPTAERKIKEIIKFSVQKWGKDVAIKYAFELENAIISVSKGLVKTKINKEFSTRFRYYRSNKHYIFFEIQGDKLIVVTLFHVAMDIENLLEEETLIK